MVRLVSVCKTGMASHEEAADAHEQQLVAHPICPPPCCAAIGMPASDWGTWRMRTWEGFIGSSTSDYAVMLQRLKLPPWHDRALSDMGTLCAPHGHLSDRYAPDYRCRHDPSHLRAASSRNGSLRPIQ
jgi:hypothetical protein